MSDKKHEGKNESCKQTAANHQPWGMASAWKTPSAHTSAEREKSQQKKDLKEREEGNKYQILISKLVRSNP